MRQVTREEYLEVFKKHSLKPISSFSDPDGVIPFGYGMPAMDTDWGKEDVEEAFCKCEMRKESRQETEWNCTYYVNDTLVGG